MQTRARLPFFAVPKSWLECLKGARCARCARANQALAQARMDQERQAAAARALAGFPRLGRMTQEELEAMGRVIGLNGPGVDPVRPNQRNNETKARP